MKKLILAIIILLLVIVLGISMYKGINLGKYRISSIEDIKIANNKLDSEIQKVDLLNTTNYVSKKNELSIAINALETKKKEYLDLKDNSDFDIERKTKASDINKYPYSEYYACFIFEKNRKINNLSDFFSLVYIYTSEFDEDWYYNKHNKE